MYSKTSAIPPPRQPEGSRLLPPGIARSTTESQRRGTIPHAVVTRLALRGLSPPPLSSPSPPSPAATTTLSHLTQPLACASVAICLSRWQKQSKAIAAVAASCGINNGSISGEGEGDDRHGCTCIVRAVDLLSPSRLCAYAYAACLR